MSTALPIARRNAEVVSISPEPSLLTHDAVEFLFALDGRFESRRGELLAERRRRQRQFDLARFSDILPELSRVRDAEWTVAPPSPSLARLEVVVVGSAERGILASGLRSGAGAFIADFDDRTSPTWSNCMEGHANLRNAVIEGGQLSDGRGRPASLWVRPRNWQLEERHFTAEDRPISATLFDFGLYFFHSARRLVDGGNVPCFSLPKLEGHLEARLWSEIFTFAEDSLGIPRGSIRVIIPIETITAAFEMEEILFELRDYALALQSSPANYLASIARTFRAHDEFLLPQREDITMEQPFLLACQELLVHTCRKHKAQALSPDLTRSLAGDDLGAAPASQWAQATVRINTKREMEMGFDGICVAAAELVPVALSAVREHGKSRPEDPIHGRCYISARDLTSQARGRITAAALQQNVQLVLEYLQAWLGGKASVSMGGQLESMATAELCCAQLWQWIHHSVRLASGLRVDRLVVESLVRDLLAANESRIGHTKFAVSRFCTAADLLLNACAGDFDSSLAACAYAHLR